MQQGRSQTSPAGLGGGNLESYVPSNVQLVKNRGMRIPNIPNDPIGLVSGLEMNQDILERSIVGNPDLGAIEIAEPGESESHVP